MNRRLRRKYIRKEKALKFTLEDIQRALKIAANMRKENKGHLYQKLLTKDKKSINLKCIFCGAPQKTKKQCDYWVMTLIDRFQSILINPTFYQDDDKEALWLQQGEVYKQIKMPLIEPND